MSCADEPHASEPRRLPGRFITFEGIDGAGKSSHLTPLAELLRARGSEVVLTREPGGTPLGEQLRTLLLQSAMDAVSETLLVFAARREHVEGVIRPALSRGATVLCDRFSDASFAYQGAGRGCDWQWLVELEGRVHGDLQPDLTLCFDLPAAMAARRLVGARLADRFERQDPAFFERVRGGYARRMAESPGRFRVIDAAVSRDAVWQQVLAAVKLDGH